MKKERKKKLYSKEFKFYQLRKCWTILDKLEKNNINNNNNNAEQQYEIEKTRNVKINRKCG